MGQSLPLERSKMEESADTTSKLQAKKNNIEFNPALETHPVSLEAIKEIAKKQGVEFRRGDIFILRTGKIPSREHSSSISSR
jgi:SRSO17 transposase